jgi:hypothetical protein
MTTHFIVKPGAYVGIPNGEIVRTVSFYQPHTVIVSDFDALNERDLVGRFEAAGIAVSTLGIRNGDKCV